MQPYKYGTGVHNDESAFSISLSSKPLLLPLSLLDSSPIDTCHPLKSQTMRPSGIHPLNSHAFIRTNPVEVFFKFGMCGKSWPIQEESLRKRDTHPISSKRSLFLRCLAKPLLQFRAHYLMYHIENNWGPLFESN